MCTRINGPKQCCWPARDSYLLLWAACSRQLSSLVGRKRNSKTVRGQARNQSWATRENEVRPRLLLPAAVPSGTRGCPPPPPSPPQTPGAIRRSLPRFPSRRPSRRSPPVPPSRRSLPVTAPPAACVAAHRHPSDSTSGRPSSCFSRICYQRPQRTTAAKPKISAYLQTVTLALLWSHGCKDTRSDEVFYEPKQQDLRTYAICKEGWIA